MAQRARVSMDTFPERRRGKVEREVREAAAKLPAWRPRVNPLAYPDRIAGFRMGSTTALTDGIRADFLVLGSGIAGLRAALELARHGEVLVVTKDQPTESNTGYAQGGVAVALATDDDVDLHLEDTL